MDISIFLAKVFSIYFLVMGLAVIIRRAHFQEMFEELFKSKASLFIMSWLALVVGILLVVSHPAFTPDWRSVITVIGWLALLKGIIHLFIPKMAITCKCHMLKCCRTYYIIGAILLILAIYLGCHGFFCQVAVV